MRIGIDIDDTITNSTEVVKEYINKYDSLYCDDNRLKNKINEIVRGTFADEIVRKFFRDYSLEMGNKIKVKDNAKEIIDKLKNEGNEIYIITARSDLFYDDAQKFCEEYLKNNEIYFDKLITAQTYKVECCKNEKIDLMIDDAVDTVENLNKENIKAILFNSELNIDKNTNVKRVNNWLELYNAINNM